MNPSDVLTKHVPGELLDCHLRTLGLEIRGSRAETAPTLDSVTAERMMEWLEPEKDDTAMVADARRNHGRHVRFSRTVSYQGIFTAGRGRPTKEARKTKSVWKVQKGISWADAIDEERGIDSVVPELDEDHGNDWTVEGDEDVSPGCVVKCDENMSPSSAARCGSY